MDHDRTLPTDLCDAFSDVVLFHFERDALGECRFLWVAGASSAIAGCDPDAALSRPGAYFESLPPPFRVRMQRALEQAAHDLVPVRTELRRTMPDGGERWTDLIAYPASADGGRTAFRGIEVDMTERQRIESRLRDSSMILRAISESTPDMMFAKDRGGRLVFLNPALARALGRPPRQLLGRTDAENLSDAGEAQAIRDTDVRIMRTGQAEAVEETVRLPGGTRTYLATKSPWYDDHGNLLGLVGLARDVTDRVAAQEALHQEKERALVTLGAIGDAVIATDPDGRITYLNPVAEAMTGWNSQDAIGQPVENVFHVVADGAHAPARNPVQTALRENRSVALELDAMLVRRDGHASPIEDSAAPIHDRTGRVIGAVLVFRDVTESRAATLRLSHMAQHDFLTGLPNRLLLQDRLAQAMARARRERTRVALLFLDLDRFKHVNDSLGHAIGDKLLQVMARRLLAAVRGTDTVSRQGGDEFVILLPDIERVQDAGRIAEHLLAAGAAPYFVSGHELHVSFSIGISIHPDDAPDIETMMRNADAAMYQAKAEGRNTCRFFNAGMNARATERLLLGGHMRAALNRNELVLYYQPRMDLRTGAIVGSEALVRWRHPERGLLTPGQFIPLAEDSGFILPIGSWVLREACRQNRDWQDAGFAALPVSVNISALQFRQASFLQDLDRILRETGLSPEYLEFELTESVVMQDPDQTAELLRAIKSRGVRIALDDFGTGYSSLGSLRRLPIDTLKIDGSFVRDVSSDGNAAAITDAIISMARSLNQRVVAEGVETSEQMDFLRSHACDEVQGYFVAHPMPPQDVIHMFGPPPPVTH